MIHHYTEAFLLNYIGIPYAKLDCYDLIRLYHEKELSNILPNLKYERPHGKVLNERDDLDELKKVANDAMLQGFKRVTYPKHGDIILIRIFNMPLHVGLYLNERQFLHTQRRTGSCIENISIWGKRILGYYRYDQV